MSMKRANGTGSVYKMKHKPLRKPYRAVVTLGYTDEGKAIRKTVGTFAKSKDAWEALALYDASPEAYERKNTTFGEVWEWMIEAKTRAGASIKSGGYSASKAKLQPLFHMPMKDIRLAHLSAIFDRYMHLKAPSHEQLKNALSSVFKEAIRNDIIDKDYSALLRIKPKEKSDLHKPFTEEEIGVLWQHAGEMYARVILIYIYTGLRVSELLQLKTDNVDIKNRYMIGGLKTKAGINRKIPIAKCIYPFVRDLYAQAKFSGSSTLLPEKLVKKYHPSEQLASYCLNIGLSAHRMHDTRHTFVTMARNYGLDVFSIKEIVGHSHRGDLTSAIYTHKTIKELIAEVDKLPVFLNNDSAEKLSNG